MRQTSQAKVDGGERFRQASDLGSHSDTRFPSEITKSGRSLSSSLQALTWALAHSPARAGRLAAAREGGDDEVLRRPPPSEQAAVIGHTSAQQL